MLERAQQQLEAISQLHAILAEATGRTDANTARSRMLTTIAAATGYQYALLAEQEADQPYMKVTAAHFPPHILQMVESALNYSLIGYRFPNDPAVVLKTPEVEVFHSVHEYFPLIPSVVGAALKRLIGIKSIALIRQYPGDLYLGAVTFVATQEGYDQSLLEYLCKYHLSFALRLIREQEEHLRLRSRYTEELERQVKERSAELSSALGRSIAMEEKLGELNIRLANAQLDSDARLTESEALLTGLRILTESFDMKQVFTGILEILRDSLNFEHAFIMLENDQGNMAVVTSTHPIFATTTWQAQEFLQRIIGGKPQVVFDINQIPEWLAQPLEIRSLASSAIYIPLRLEKRVAILVCAHRERGFFTPRHLALARRFAPLATQALQNADLYAALKMERDSLETRITERTMELQRQRDFAMQIMESMGEGLTLTDSSGRFEYVNPAYARLLELAPDQVIGKMPEDVTFPEDHKKTGKAWELRRAGKPSTYETRLLTRSGAPVRALITAVPRFRDDEFLGSIAVVTNISERARLEQMKTDFINRASHDLRTPLTTAILMADLLEGGGTEQEQGEFLATLKQELNRERMLFEDLLMVGRLESGRYAFHLFPTEIPPLIEEAMTSIKPQADLRQITVQAEIETSLCIVRADRQSLLAALLNVLSNAVKFSHPEGRALVSARNFENGVIITVQDNGIGIPADDLPHISTRFFRAQNATRQEVQGTGVGLYIVNETVKGMNGWMKIESVENQGTTISIWIPAEEEILSQP